MYFKENIPVFLLFISFNAVILFIGYVDNSIPNVAVTYIFCFNLLIFAAYILWDLLRKRQFNNEFQKLESLEDASGMMEGNTPQQRIIYGKLNEMRMIHQHELDR